MSDISLGDLIPSINKPRVVIVGGGFGGITFAKKIKNKGFQVVMLDRYNYHLFQPLLYQVATAGLEPDSIAGPLRKIMNGYKDFHFLMLKVEGVNLEEKIVETLVGQIKYDYLVVAAGARTNFFGIAGIHKNSFPLKQLPHALDLRSQVFQSLEKAVITEDVKERQKLLNFLIVGGGPTGVEVAGALSELKKHVLPKDYPTLDLEQMRIYLVEHKDRLLAGMSIKSSQKSLKYLKNMGVEVKLGCLTKDYDGEYAVLSTHEKIATKTLIWAAGVKGNLLKGLSSDSIERERIVVNEYNQVRLSEEKELFYKNVFAIGDIAIMKTKEYPMGHPGVAQVAIQQGGNLAKNLLNLRKNKSLKSFHYSDKGTLATIGRNKAVSDLPLNIKLSGILGWAIWMGVHLYSIVGFRNKLIVLANWLWSYLNYDRGIRLIVRPVISGDDVISQNLEKEKRE